MPAGGSTGSWSGGGTSDGELLVDTADRLRWRAPELTLEFARQAATRAQDARDRALALRANALVVFALVRLGKHAEAVEPAVQALREAESTGSRELAGSIRVDLAASTRAVGLAGSAFVLVRPMLEGSDARPVIRAGALAEIVAGLAQAGRREVIDEVLSEADRLYAADESVGSDVRRVLRALLCARVASFRRRWGNHTGAVASATEGMTLLDGLSDPATDSGQARAELGLEMVSALLDAGEEGAALGQAEQTLNQTVRATTAAAIGRLLLVLATRVHIPAGRPKEAHSMLAEIVRMARRHELDGLLADVLTSLAHAQEADGELTLALDSLRSARAAEQRRLRADTLARMIVLEELGAGTRLPDDTEALLRRVVRTPARSLPEVPGRAAGSREAASREMAGPELGGRDLVARSLAGSSLAGSSLAGSSLAGSSLAGRELAPGDVLGRELAGWEMVARERAAMDLAGQSRAGADLVAADRDAPDWAGSPAQPVGRARTEQSSVDKAALGRAADRAALDRTASEWVDSDQAARAQAAIQAAQAMQAEQGSAVAGRSRAARRRAEAEAAAVASGETPHWPREQGPEQQWPEQGATDASERENAERDEETGLLNRQGLRRRLAAARRQARPTALTLVRLEPPGEPDAEPEPQPRNPDPDSTDRFSAALIKAIDRAGRMPEVDPDVLSSLAGHVRDMAPQDAELARPDEGELAVLLPDTTMDEAEQFAATLRESVSDWDPRDPARSMSMSTGVAEYQEGTSEDALLSAAREALTSDSDDADADAGHQQPMDWQSVEPVYDLPPEDGDEAYTYIEEYAQLSSDAPDSADSLPDPELAEYLAGFSLPEYGQWAPAEDPGLTPDPDPAASQQPLAAKHDADATADTGRSVLDRLGITRGSGGRRRAPDSFDADQSTDFDSADFGPAGMSSSYASTGDEILAAAEQGAAQASIPQVPEPEEIPVPPDSPEVPIPPDPDTQPTPRRHRFPSEPDNPEEDPTPTPRPDRKRPSPFPASPDIPEPPSLITDPDPEPEPRPRSRTTQDTSDPGDRGETRSRLGAPPDAGMPTDLASGAESGRRLRAGEDIPKPPGHGFDSAESRFAVSREIQASLEPAVESEPGFPLSRAASARADVPQPSGSAADSEPESRFQTSRDNPAPSDVVGDSETRWSFPASFDAPFDAPAQADSGSGPEPRPRPSASPDLAGRAEPEPRFPAASAISPSLDPAGGSESRFPAARDISPDPSVDPEPRPRFRASRDIAPDLVPIDQPEPTFAASKPEAPDTLDADILDADTERTPRRRRRWTSEANPEEPRERRRALPPEPSAPLDPPVGPARPNPRTPTPIPSPPPVQPAVKPAVEPAAEPAAVESGVEPNGPDGPGGTAGLDESPQRAGGGRASRMRRREKTDVKLADLLAEALVAYQSSTAEGLDEDVLSSYDDLSTASGQGGPDPGRHRFPDRAPGRNETN